MAPILHGIFKRSATPIISNQSFGFLSMGMYFLFGNCSTGCFCHCYREQPYSLCQTDLRENVQEALESGVVSAGELPSGAWWVFFQDEQLNRLMEVSLACYLDIHIAEARIRRAYEEALAGRDILIFFPIFLGWQICSEKKDQQTRGKGSFPTCWHTLYTNDLKAHIGYIRARCMEKKPLDLLRFAGFSSGRKRAEYEEARLLLSTALAGVYFDLQMKWLQRGHWKTASCPQRAHALHKQHFSFRDSSQSFVSTKPIQMCSFCKILSMC